MSGWIEANARLRERPFNFKGYESQRAIADDMYNNMSVIKCSQTGLTEVQIWKLFAFLKRTSSINDIFTLPTDDIYKRVSQTHSKPLRGEERGYVRFAPPFEPLMYLE